jgi:hypothetical protein
MEDCASRARHAGILRASTIALCAATAACLTSTSSGTPPSHFHVSLDSADVTIDCTKLDQTGAPGNGPSVWVGGASASTSETFSVLVPNSATTLRDPATLTSYPIIDPGNVNQLSPIFSIALILYDKPTAQPDPNPEYDSCAAGECGLPTPDPAHSHQITSIVEQSSSTAGQATFRITGTFDALTRVVGPSQQTAEATGDWSLLVTVADPGTSPASGDAGQ